MLAYLVSVSVRLLLAYAIGSPSCNKQAPSPLWEASTCTVTGFLQSYYRKGLVALLAIKSFIFWKLAFATSSQAKTASFLSIAQRGSVWWLRCGTKFPMYVTIPMNLASCCLSMGGVISVIPCIFFRQGCMPSALYSAPKNETLGHLSSNFLLFSTSPSTWATLRRLIRLASWSSSDRLYTTMSLWMLITPGHLSMMRSIFIWKTSCDILAPKGILLNL